MPATHSIVQAAMRFLYINPMKIPLLTLVSRANFQVDELPLLDPVIARCFPDLHAKLSAIAPADKQAEIGQILQVVSRIEQINSGAADVDRDLLEYCDLPSVIPRVDPALAAGHPAASVRVAFYEFARQRKLPIVKYLEHLTCAGLFDPKTRDIAMELIASQLPSLPKGRLSHRNLAHLQCIPLRPDAPLFRTACDAIEGSDNFTEACSWVRFLYHRDQPVREAAQDALRDIFRFRPALDVSRQLRSDPYVESFLKKLRSPTKIQTSGLAESFFATITSTDQPDFIKKVSAERLAELILDPFTDVQPILPEIRDLPFEAFPELIHAAAIRDGSWKIASVAKLFELVKALTEENSKHLLPVLSRTVFAPLVNIECDGADLLRLPVFVTERYDVLGSSVCYEPKVYAATETVPLAPIADEWMKVSRQRRKPIVESFEIRVFILIVVANKRLAADILQQIDEEETAAAKLAASGPPQLVLYLLLLAVLTAKTPSAAAAKICQRFEQHHVQNALKLNQALVETGGDCPLPSRIIEYVLDPSTRRSALSCLVTHARFKKDLPADLDFDRLRDLYGQQLPVNINRQLGALLLFQERNEAATRICEHRDAVTKSLAFHRAPADSEMAALALVCASNDKESICARAAAVELLCKFCRDRPVPSQNLAALYHTHTGETLLSLQLLRFLNIPSVRSQVSQANEFIVPFLHPDTNELFVKAGLNALFGQPFGADIAVALTSLVRVELYTNHVLQVIALAPESSLAYFESDLIEAICTTFGHCNLTLSMAAINHVLLSGVLFPAHCMERLISLYETYLDASCTSTCLHAVFSQVFASSDDARDVALAHGFPMLVIRELAEAAENEEHFDEVLNMCAQFVYGYPPAQRAIFKEWTIETLIDLFHPSPTTLHFYLSLAARNPEAQALFATEVNSESLLVRILELFDLGKNCDAALIQLLGTVLNSEVVRRIVYRKKKVKAFVSRLTYAVAKKDWAIAEAMLRVFVTLTFFQDGVDELIEILSENDEVWETLLLQLFVRNLRGHARIWTGLAGAVQKTDIGLFERLNALSGPEIVQ
jgi:hypothetical protein